MSRIYLSIGSNIDRYQHITACLDALQSQFGELTISRVYESESVGFEGDHFLNLAAGFESSLSVGELLVLLRAIEDDNGRVRNGPKFSSRTLDIDILTYDDVVGLVDGVELPRDELSKNAFVLLPMVDIASEQLHPQLLRSYQSLWADYDQASQKLWPVEFNWQGKAISQAEA